MASSILRGSLRKTSLPTGFLIPCIRLIFAMRSLHKPTKPERLYVDFDGFFASCEEQADPRLFGCPVGVIPFRDARNSCVIAANSKAKRFGVKTGIAIAEVTRPRFCTNRSERVYMTACGCETGFGGGNGLQAPGAGGL